MTLLVFDCDGVLLDSELLADQVVIDYCQTQFPAVDFSGWLERMTGLSIAEILSGIGADRQIQFAADAEQRILTLLDQRLRNEVQPIAGVANALAALPGRKAVASNSHSEYLFSLLGEVGLLGYFDGRVYGADRVARGKPDPAIYQLAARESAVRVDQCLVIEDSVPGVTAAVAAGMVTIGFVGGGHCSPAAADNLCQAGATTILDDMQHLPALVAQLQSS